MELVGKSPGPSRSTRTIAVVTTVAVLGAVAAFGASKLILGGSERGTVPEVSSLLDREKKVVQVRAQNRRAQTSARNAMTAMQVYFIDYGTFKTMSPSTLEEIEPALDFTTDESSGPTVASFRDTWVGVMIAVYNGDGRCFALGHRPDRKFGYRARAVKDADECRAHAFTPSGLRAHW